MNNLLWCDKCKSVESHKRIYICLTCGDIVISSPLRNDVNSLLCERNAPKGEHMKIKDLKAWLKDKNDERVIILVNEDREMSYTDLGLLPLQEDDKTLFDE
jgi:hypothetical protein